MSHQNKLRRWLSLERIDVTLAWIGVLVCVLLLGLRLLAAQILLIVVPVAAGLGCVLYLAAQNRRATAFEFSALPRNVTGYLPSAVFLGLAGLVLLVFSAGQRTLPVYLLTGAIGAVLLGQILVVDETDVAPGLVLGQILVAAVVIRMSALFVTPGFIGVDTWTHVPVFVEGIVREGSLSVLAGDKYSMAPFYHTIGAVAALVFDSARTGLYLSIGLLVPLSAVFVYAITKLFVPVRWALLATALYVFSDQFIKWGLYIIPTSLGLVFFLGVLYCVTKLFYNNDGRVIALLLVFSLTIVFTHQVSTAILLTFLGLAVFSVVTVQLLGGQPRGTTTRGTIGLVGTFLVTLGVTLASWLQTPWISDRPFVVHVLDIFRGTVAGEAGFLNLGGGSGNNGDEAVAESAGLLTELVPFIDWFGFAVLLLATVIGGLAMLRLQTPTDLTLTYIFTAAAMFVATFGLSLFGIRTLLPDRWLVFLHILLVIIGAIGLYYLSQHASRRVLLVVLVVVALGYPMTMVGTHAAAQDNPVFETEQIQYSYSESEIAAVETISTMYPPDADRRMYSDYPYESVFRRSTGISTYSDTVILDETGPTVSGPVVSREYQTLGPAVFYTGDPIQRSSMAVAPERICPPQRNHVYTNNGVRMCTSAAAGPGTGA